MGSSRCPAIRFLQACGSRGACNVSRTHRALSGSAMLLFQVVLRMGTVVLLTPILLHYENRETLGAYSVILQIIVYLQLLELGMTQAIARELAQGAGRGGAEERFGRLVNTSVAFLSVVGIVAAVLTGVLAWSLPRGVAAGPPVLPF